MLSVVKRLLPDRPVPMRVLRGPFRGARIVAAPRASLRKVLGLYEHELNGWLEQTLPSVTRLLDVGANDGYFTLGCAAAFDRLGIAGEILSFEPQAAGADALREAIARRSGSRVRIDVVQALVGDHVSEGMTTLDSVAGENRRNTLIKIDVEGAEIDVIRGAESWINSTNAFVIEVHRRPFLDQVRALFERHGVRLRQIDQRPLPLLGREARDEENWWLVSE